MYYNVIDIIMLGYETTSNCLAYTSYLLALNPDKQDTLYQEIENYYQEYPVRSRDFSKGGRVAQHHSKCL